jgi:hypothetical protein
MYVVNYSICSKIMRSKYKIRNSIRSPSQQGASPPTNIKSAISALPREKTYAVKPEIIALFIDAQVNFSLFALSFTKDIPAAIKPPEHGLNAPAMPTNAPVIMP